MSNIGATLKRKFGPLPVWGWAIVAFIAVYWYRNKSGLSASASTATTGGSITPVSPTPQPITTLGPGESAYDPNTGQLVSSPAAPSDTTGGGGDGSGGMADPSNAIDNLAQSIADAIAAGTSGGESGATVTAAGAPATKTKPGKNHTGKRVAKPKQGNKAVKGGKGRTRSHANTKSQGHGSTRHANAGHQTHKTQAHGNKTATSHTRTNSAVKPAKAGGRIKTAITQVVTRQRPTASHQPAPKAVHPSPARQAPTRTAPRSTPARHPSTPAPKPAPAPPPRPSTRAPAPAPHQPAPPPPKPPPPRPAPKPPPPKKHR